MSDMLPSLLIIVGAILCTVPGNSGRLHFPGGPSKTYTSSGGNVLPSHCGVQKVPATHPWIAKLGYRESGSSKISFLCAGVLINKRYVLTTSVCLHPRNIGRQRLTLVHLGDEGLNYPLNCKGEKCSGPKIEVPVESYIIHPEYNKYHNDIGLVRLKEDADLPSHYFEPVCLPKHYFSLSNSLTRNGRLQVAGWIIRYGFDLEHTLHSLPVHLVPESKCEESFGGKFVPGKNMCVQDNCMLAGSPLLHATKKGAPLKVIGLASFGLSPCRSENTPTVYTSVSKHLKWISKNLNP